MVRKLYIFLFFTAFIFCTPTEEVVVPYIEPLHTYTAYETSCIESLDGARVDNGLQPLILSNGLSKLAQEHANYLSLNQITNHDDFPSRLYVAITVMDFESLSENLAYGYSNVDGLMSAWLTSDIHRHVLLDVRVTHHGFAVSMDIDGKNYYVHLLSHR